MPHLSQSRSGFSLVEIVIAIGIAAFTLAAIGGIFGVSNQAALDSSRDTLLTSMIGEVMGDLRPLPFDVIWNADPRGQTQAYLATLQPAPAPPPAPPTGAPAASVYYFTSEGVMIETTATPPSATAFSQPPPNAVYRCQVTKIPDVTTKGFNAANATAGYNRLQLTLRFDWPVAPGGTTSGPNVKLVYESIARYF